MIEIDIARKDGEVEGFQISGHARMARAGHDICCAAISAISQTALLGLMKELEQKPEYEIRDGWLEVKLNKDTTGSDLIKARIIFNTMEAGLRWIADEYPRRVRFKGEAIPEKDNKSHRRRKP